MTPAHSATFVATRRKVAVGAAAGLAAYGAKGARLMALEITKVETKTLPTLRFIGKPCLCSPEDFVAKWDEWLEKGWFKQLEKLGVAPENGDAYLGMTSDSGSRYWIGLLFPPGTPAPDGFEYMDISASNYIVFGIDGKKEGELTGEEGAVICFGEIDKRSLTHDSEGQDLERYSRPLSSDGKGKMLLECLFPIK